jgi:cobalamin synthase
MRKLERFPAWFLKFFLGALTATVGTFLLLAYLLRIPAAGLVRPWLVCLAVFSAWGSLMYFALWHRVRTGGDTRLVFAMATLIGVTGCWLVAYWACRLGLISRSDYHGLCVTALIAGPVIMLLAYFVERKWLPLP